MSGTPEVSAVMSVYNGASTLVATLDSILSQDGVELEFIIVNDGSTDGTHEILDGYARRDPRIRVIHQENSGLTRALICGCAAASGEFIARQDAGDISLPERLQRQAALLREWKDCAFVSCWADVVGPKGEFLHPSRGTGVAREPTYILSPQLEWGLTDGPTHHSSVMFRSKHYALCGGYRPEFYFGQDWDLWYRLAAVGKFCTIQKTLCVCRIATNSISGRHKRRQEQFAQLSKKAMLLRQRGMTDQAVLDEARRLIASPNSPISRREEAAGNYFIGKCLMDNHNRAAVGYLLKAIKEHPLHFRAWLSLTRSVFARSLL
jgi:glycosyltransferase involved in cell wall biosynthesis